MKRGARRILPLTFGWEHLPKRVSVPLAPPPDRDLPMREPIPGVLVEVGAGFMTFRRTWTTTSR